MTDPGTDTRLVPIAGRNIVVRLINDAQVALLLREARYAQRDDVTQERRMDAGARMFDIMESAVVQESDRKFLLEKITEGSVEMEDLMSFVTVFRKPPEDEKPKVRRGRPPARRS